MGSIWRSRLGWKLFLSYLVVMVVGLGVLAVTVELVIPAAFERHMAGMNHMMGGGPMRGQLYNSFRNGVTDAMVLAGLATFLTAILVSWFVARQVIRPVRDLAAASQQIAAGDYQHRVTVPVGAQPGGLDELGHLAFSFNQMAERLDQTEAMRTRLIGDVAHELRTPLTTIKGSLEGLIDGVLPADEQTFARLYQEADRLQRLAMDLQELSRVEAHAYELIRRSTPIGELIQETAEHLRPQFEDKGVALAVELPAGLPHLPVDPDRLHQVLINLIGNALQYTPAGGQVQVSARLDGPAVTITIRDTGIGLTADQIQHVFTRFYRAEPSRSRAGGGSGIGLTIARHLVEAHGGRIWAESAGPNQGSTFAFTLPLEP